MGEKDFRNMIILSFLLSIFTKGHSFHILAFVWWRFFLSVELLLEQRLKTQIAPFKEMKKTIQVDAISLSPFVQIRL